MLSSTRSLSALLLAALFSLQVACASQDMIEESLQPVGEEAPAEAPTASENTDVFGEIDSEKQKALDEASAPDFTDPSQVELNGDGSPAGAVESVDTMPFPDGSAIADSPLTPEAPTASELGLDSGLSVSIYFAMASFKISGTYRGSLNDIAARLKADRSLNVVLVGHCDNRGRNDFNRRLANKRARAVKSALLKLGVKAKQMRIGAPQLAQSGSTEDEHAQNRRVEIR